MRFRGGVSKHFPRKLINNCIVEIDTAENQGQKFVAVGAESRFSVFSATNRDIWHSPRQIAIFSNFRDESRFLCFSATDRDYLDL